MSTNKDRVGGPLPQRIQQSFAQLASAADELNAVSNELGSVIVKIERVLQGLNVGVPAWVSFRAAMTRQRGGRMILATPRYTTIGGLQSEVDRVTTSYPNTIRLASGPLTNPRAS